MDLGMAASPASAAKREYCLKVRHDLKYYSLVICARVMQGANNFTSRVTVTLLKKTFVEFKDLLICRRASNSESPLF